MSQSCATTLSWNRRKRFFGRSKRGSKCTSHDLNDKLKFVGQLSIPHPVIDQFHILTSDDFPAPTSPPPTRGRGCLPTGRRTINSDFNAAAFAGVAQRPKCAPSMIGRSNHQQPL